MVKSVIFDHRSPQLILTLKMANQFFVLHDTPADNDAPSSQIWLQTVHGSYYHTHIHSDSDTPHPPTNFITGGIIITFNKFYIK